MAKKQPEPAPVEAGEVATEQRVEEPVADVVVPFPAASAPTEAELSGPEVAEIRARNDSVDKAAKAVDVARDDWVQASRLAQYGQEALTVLVRNLIVQKGLEPTLRYRIDIDRGRIVPVGPNG